MSVRSLDQTVDRYARGCILAYLEGEQSWEWVVGCLSRSGADAERIRAAIARTEGYGDAARWERLSEFYSPEAADV